MHVSASRRWGTEHDHVRSKRKGVFPETQTDRASPCTGGSRVFYPSSPHSDRGRLRAKLLPSSRSRKGNHQTKLDQYQGKRVLENQPRQDASQQGTIRTVTQHTTKDLDVFTFQSQKGKTKRKSSNKKKRKRIKNSRSHNAPKCSSSRVVPKRRRGSQRVPVQKHEKAVVEEGAVLAGGRLSMAWKEFCKYVSALRT